MVGKDKQMSVIAEGEIGKENVHNTIDDLPVARPKPWASF